ncbi:hypothetical protein D3C75_1316280 [compost metagenome]
MKRYKGDFRKIQNTPVHTKDGGGRLLLLLQQRKEGFQQGLSQRLIPGAPMVRVQQNQLVTHKGSAS